MRNRKQKNPPAPRCFAFPLIKGDHKNNPNRGIVSSPSFEHPRYRWGRPADGGGAAFTLVELIVVVTILAILATIGFVSYSSYLTGVRDTNRIAQMTSLSDGLNLYSTRNDLPIPEDNVEVSVNGNLIAYQGYAGANILETINFEKGGVDPKDNTYFSYYLTGDRKYFQLMGFLEESADLTALIPSPSPLEEKGASIVPSPGRGGLGRGVAQANYQNRIPTVTGKKLGILTDVNNNPVQEAGIDVNITDTSTEEYKAYLTNDNILEGQGSTLVAMNPKASCKRIRETSTARKDGIYTISPDGTDIEVYCDMTTDGGGWTLVLHGTDKDISIHDSRGSSAWLSGGNTIPFKNPDDSFKFSDDILNKIRTNNGIYRVDAVSSEEPFANFYFKSSCDYDHDLGNNGDCSIMYDDMNFKTAHSCLPNAGRKGLGCWQGIITNHSDTDNIVCYRGLNDTGRCTNDTTNGNISVKVYVK